MCELCDARARKRAVDAVEDFKLEELPSNVSSFTESAVLTPTSYGVDALIGDIPTDLTNQRQKVEDDESLYALLPGTTNATLPVLNELVTWAKSHGAIFHERVEIYLSPTHEVKLRVKPVPFDEAIKDSLPSGTTDCSSAEATTNKINTSCPLPANSHIVTSPFSLSLSYLNALDTLSIFPSHNGTTAPFLKSWMNVVSPSTVGVFFLMQQYLLGGASFWAPYIKSLPQPQFTEVSFSRLLTFGKWGPWSMKWDIEAARKRCECFRMDGEECECANYCRRKGRVPKNPYSPLVHHEANYFDDGGFGVLKWGEKCEDERQWFEYMHGEAREENEEEDEDKDEDEDMDEDAKWEKYWKSIEPVQELYAHEADWVILGPLWEWAQAIFHSRSFPSTILPASAFGDMTRKPAKKGEEMTWVEKIWKEPFPILLPLLDMVNHSPNSKVRTLVNGASERPTAEETFNGGVKERRLVQIGAKDVPSVGLSNEVDIPAGGEICFGYKPRRLEEMLLGFGYERGKRKRWRL